MKRLPFSWHCCSRLIRSNFCPHCGKPRPEVEYSPPEIEDLLNEALIIVEIFESNEQSGKNAADTLKRKASELRRLIADGNPPKRYFSADNLMDESDAERLESQAAGVLKTGLLNAHRKHVMQNLILKAGLQ